MIRGNVNIHKVLNRRPWFITANQDQDCDMAFLSSRSMTNIPSFVWHFVSLVYFNSLEDLHGLTGTVSNLLVSPEPSSRTVASVDINLIMNAVIIIIAQVFIRLSDC